MREMMVRRRRDVPITKRWADVYSISGFFGVSQESATLSLAG